MRLVADLLLASLLCVFASEALLRVPGLFGAAQGDVADFRVGARRARVVSEAAGERHRVVCLGDSVTFGAGVGEEEAYPSQLALALERVAPGRFEVLNFGVTALDSAMARERLDVLLRRLAPDTVVLWVGSNDSDIAIELGGEGRIEAQLGALAARSRLATLLLGELQDRRIERAWEFASERPVGAAPLPPRAATEARARIEHNLDEMARLARDAGADLMLVKYPGHTPRLRIAMVPLSCCPP